MVSRMYVRSRLSENSSNDDLSFMSFAQFPPEIRQMIWRMTLPRPRRIRRYHDGAQIPIAFSINRESRQLAQRTYSVIRPLVMPRYNAKTLRYVDFSVDFVYESALATTAMEGIQNLVIDITDTALLGKLLLDKARLHAKSLPRLRRVLIVVHQGNEELYGPLSPSRVLIQNKLEVEMSTIIDALHTLKTYEGHRPQVLTELCKPCYAPHFVSNRAELEDEEVIREPFPIVTMRCSVP